MKKITILLISCILSIGLYAQTGDRAIKSTIDKLQQDNNELKKQMWAIKQEFKTENIKQTATLDSLLEVLNYTQYVVNKQSDSLDNTGEKLITLEEVTETHKEGVSDYIYHNRINMGIIFLIIIAFNIIIFIILRNQLNKNFTHTENKFHEAFLTFDDDIKAASAMLNKHIKEVKTSLSNQIKTTNEAIDTQLKSITNSVDKKVSETKALFDEHAAKIKEEFTNEIKASKENLKKNIKKTETAFDEKLDDILKSMNEKLDEHSKLINDKIAEIKKNID